MGIEGERLWLAHQSKYIAITFTILDGNAGIDQVQAPRCWAGQSRAEQSRAKHGVNQLHLHQKC